MITIIANYRTGSSNFTEELSRTTGLRFHEQYTGEWLHKCHFKDQSGYRPPSKKYQIYKIMPDHIHEDYWEQSRDQYLVDSQVFYIVRSNVEDQFRSHVSCLLTGNWHPGQSQGPWEWPDDLMVDEEIMFITERTLQGCIPRQHYIYKRWPGQVIFYEDRYRQKSKYPKRKVTFTEGQLKRIKKFAEQFNIRKMYE